MKDLQVRNKDWVIKNGRAEEITGTAVIAQRLDRLVQTAKGELFYSKTFGSSIQDALHSGNLQHSLNQLQDALEDDEAVKETDITIQTQEPLVLEIDITLLNGNKLNNTLAL